MVSWNNLDTLKSFKKLESTKRVDLKAVMSGESGAKRVKGYSVPMACGLSFNYAAKAVDEEVLTVLPEAPLANPDAPFDSLVLDTLTIRANRSWSATLDGQDTDWIRLRSDEFLNLAENERAIPLVLECKRNFDRMPRGVNLVISTPDGSLTVPVVQAAAEYRLDAELTRTELVSMLDTTVLKVRCNTAWTISLVDPAAAAFVSFSSTQGTDNEAVKVMFNENIDLEAGREAPCRFCR